MEGDHCRKLWALSVSELVFSDDNRVSLKSEFEGVFRSFGESVHFTYFKSFQRVLIAYDSEESATMAYQRLQGAVFNGMCIVLQQVKPVSIGGSSLDLPNKTHNFLISPPPSPPMGWEPIEEAPPVIDYNLIAAMSRLRLPGEPQQVYNGTGSIPSIVVSCMDPPTDEHTPILSQFPSSIVQTSRPPNYH